ncbi:MAG: allophanate hydrolase [Akkermansiaceae bacterium]
MPTLPPLNISSIQAAYDSGEWTPTSLIKAIHACISAMEPTNIWITLLSEEQLVHYASSLELVSKEDKPLFGIPFAIKDNIDLAGVPTTAACPDYAYTPEESAFVVQTLIDAGAIPIGKTNLDQFATGLVGVRSPYGTPANAYHEDYIPGGSSSGSAVAVARGLVSFSLGTDTAGSGRVPASFNQLVGHKPTKGLLSCSGVIPACRSLDCVSIFANNASDAESVFDVAAVFDENDVYSRKKITSPRSAPLGETFTFGVPQAEQLKFFGNTDAAALFDQSIKQLESIGGTQIEIDFSPFLEAALLLYEGPWVAERYVAIESVITNRPEILHPITRQIISGGNKPNAADGFKAEYQLKALKRIADQVFDTVDIIITPTAGTIYTQNELANNPIELNSNLGYYTNFMNLLDYAATAFPAGTMQSKFPKLPFGITAFAPTYCDQQLLDLAARFAGEATVSEEIPTGWNAITVCGAHLNGLALNWQLTDRGAKLWKKTETAPLYHFYALPPITLDNGAKIPPRPGVLRVTEGGVALKVEVWLIPTEQFGSFVANIPAPLGIGKITLADGTNTPGFICEPYALKNAQDITHLADWRAFLNCL